MPPSSSPSIRTFLASKFVSNFLFSVPFLIASKNDNDSGDNLTLAGGMHVSLWVDHAFFWHSGEQYATDLQRAHNLRAPAGSSFWHPEQQEDETDNAKADVDAAADDEGKAAIKIGSDGLYVFYMIYDIIQIIIFVYSTTKKKDFEFKLSHNKNIVNHSLTDMCKSQTVLTLTQEPYPDANKLTLIFIHNIKKITIRVVLLLNCFTL